MTKRERSVCLCSIFYVFGYFGSCSFQVHMCFAKKMPREEIVKASFRLPLLLAFYWHNIFIVLIVLF